MLFVLVAPAEALIPVLIVVGLLVAAFAGRETGPCRSSGKSNNLQARSEVIRGTPIQYIPTRRDIGLENPQSTTKQHSLVVGLDVPDGYRFRYDVDADYVKQPVISYHFHNCLNRNLEDKEAAERSWPAWLSCDSLTPSDSGQTDGQMQQSRGAAAENCASLEDTSGASPTHPDGVVA